MRSNEEQVLGAAGLDGIVLRYGLFYGPGPASDALIGRQRWRRLVGREVDHPQCVYDVAIGRI
jgi:hypothetical protein